MRVLVCGGRDFGVVPPDLRYVGWGQYARERAAEHQRLLQDTLDVLAVDRGLSVVIHGAAKGADELAGRWARRKLMREEPYKANWYPNGRAGGLDRSAGPKRNQRMLDEGKPDLVVAFPGGKGTADCVKRARAMGIEVIEVSR